MNQSNISIKKMIVHQVNHHIANKKGFVLSDLDLPVEKYPDVVDLLIKHIATSLNHVWLAINRSGQKSFKKLVKIQNSFLMNL